MMSPDGRRDRLAAELAGAVERQEIVAHYQPQFSLETGAIVSVEALSRWEHPEFGVVPPGEFIPIAEESGLIGEIGRHMIDLGCETAAEWQDQGLAVEVAVNVSLLQLRDPAFGDRFLESIASASVDPHLMIVEITESTDLSDVPGATESLEALATTGVTISVDDFGTGFSSEAQTIALPATELKLDQHLVRNRQEPADRLSAAVRFGKSRGMRLVAEGVETARQLARVRTLNCDRAQGYFLGRPAPKSRLDPHLVRAF